MLELTRGVRLKTRSTRILDNILAFNLETALVAKAEMDKEEKDSALAREAREAREDQVDKLFIQETQTSRAQGLTLMETSAIFIMLSHQSHR